MQTLTTLDYWAVAIYMLLMAGIGLFLGKFIKNIGDYFKGGNAIPWVSGAISNFMTKFSTFIFVAYAGIAYEHGFVALTLIWSTVLPALVGVAFFAKRWRRAGVMTDVVQFIILMVAALILVPLTIQAAGGLSQMKLTIPDHFTWFNGPKGMPLFLMVYYLMILVKYSGNWTFIQRFYSVRDERASEKQGLLTAVFFLFFPVIFLFPSIAARAIIPDLANPEMAYVSVCLKLLPTGIMGLMVAAMFAATMSVLSGEYNVTAGVLTKDIYQRLFNPDAKGKEILWVGRLMTLFLGALITVGALYVGGFGGAFEANKLFTGLFALPMTLPLVLGIVLKRPQPWGALATVIGGMVLGLFLNSQPGISWEMATLIEIIGCVIIYLVSGIFTSNDHSYLNRVDAFFKKLATPLTEAEKPAVDHGFVRVMNRLYAVALVVTGFLFAAMSTPSIQFTSGRLAFGAGIACLALAVLLWFENPKIEQKIMNEPKVKVDIPNI